MGHEKERTSGQSKTMNPERHGMQRTTNEQAEKRMNTGDGGLA